MDLKLAQVIEAGKRIGIEVRPVIFSGETRTAEDAARAIGCELGQIVKSLVFEGDGEPLLFLVSGKNLLDAAKAARAAGVGEVSRVDAQMAKAATGYSIGATPPLGHPRPLRMFMDEDLLVYREVWAAAGRPDSVFPVDPEVLAAATGAEVRALATPP
jgi:prolyl-tRNA editing enzyme YbaK/EbsC (Cys-tRNA(Pro) deacylase)